MNVRHFLITHRIKLALSFAAYASAIDALPRFFLQDTAC